LNRIVTVVRDADEQVKAVVTSVGRNSHVYDNGSKRIARIDRLLRRNTIIYDIRDPGVGTINGLNFRTTYSNDDSSNMTRVMDAQRNRTTTVYDNLSPPGAAYRLWRMIFFLKQALLANLMKSSRLAYSLRLNASVT